MGSIRLGTADQLRKDDILSRIELGKQVMELIDETQRLAPKLRASVIVQLRRLPALHSNRTLKAALEQAYRLQKGRLAGARGTQKRDDFSRLHVEIDAAQDFDCHVTLGEAALQPARRQNRITHNGAPGPGRCSPPSMRDRAWRGTTGSAQ